nr:l-rhamnonate dehydratase [Quercus suber]
MFSSRCSTPPLLYPMLSLARQQLHLLIDHVDAAICSRDNEERGRGSIAGRKASNCETFIRPVEIFAILCTMSQKPSIASFPRVKEIKTFIISGVGSGGDYHNVKGGHWLIDSKISTPMSGYEQYAKSRTSWGINVLGSFCVEIEASDGTKGFATGFGGPPACWLVAEHFRRFVIGAGIALTCHSTRLHPLTEARPARYQPPLRADVSCVDVLWPQGSARGCHFSHRPRFVGSRRQDSE